MHRVVIKASVFALGTVASVSMYDRGLRQRKLRALHREDDQALSWEYCPPSNLTEGRAKVPEASAKEGPLVLQLQQVQVLFRHGARTPIHLTPKLSEVEYDADFVTRAHQGSMFPYMRISSANESLPGWSEYEMDLWKKPLRGGAAPGQLSTYGKEQMYMLGLSLKDCYQDRLDIATYDADQVRVMSSNIRRTVESAQSVLAGFFGKEQLIDYAECCGPVRIYLPDPCYNIMVANTDTCKVLRKNNNSTMNHPRFLTDFKEKRSEVEEHIKKRRESLLEAVTDVQAKIDLITQFYENDGVRTRRLELNKHRQHYQHDPLLQPLYDERGQAIEKVDRFWANVLNRDSVLADIITKSDMKALVYLRNLEVEAFEGTLTSGYRIHLYFDKNPFFWNRHLCKEVFTRVSPRAPPSRETKIMWKPGMEKLIMGELSGQGQDPVNVEVMDCEDKIAKRCSVVCKRACRGPPEEEVPDDPEQFFFLWYTQPTSHESDTVGKAITGDIWKNPQSLLENKPKVRDPWDKTLNFVYSRDDASARVVNGWWEPAQLRKHRDLVETNATSIMFHSMTGQNEASHGVITRLSAGPLLTEMVDTARHMMCGEKAPKLCLYSSHDNVLAAILEALEIWDEQWPPFASNLRLELYREVGGCDYYVRVFYNGKEQRIRGQSESYMHWLEFCSAVRRFTIRRDEWERICSSKILERICEEVLRHSKGDPESGGAPAGM